MGWVGAATIALGGMLFSSCARRSPVESEFVEFVADLCTQSPVNVHEAKSIAIDPACFPQSMPTLQPAIEQRLRNKGVAWFPFHQNCEVTKLPGAWDEPEPGWKLRNSSHELLVVSIGGTDVRRTVHFGYLCGPTCGSGEMLEATWDGHRWTEANRHPVLY